MKKLKKKLLIFDLDGVLIDSKDNMKFAWTEVQKKYFLNNIAFENYFKEIGRPFIEILKIIGIKKNFKNISLTYKLASIKYLNKIRYFNNVLETLKLLKAKNFELSIVTSKDLKRTKKILDKNINLFTHIECDDGKSKGKPHPNKILKIIKKTQFEKSNALYVGDTNIDYLTAKNSNIDFMFIKKGYGKNFNYKYKCNTVSDLIKKIQFG